MAAAAVGQPSLYESLLVCVVKVCSCVVFLCMYGSVKFSAQPAAARRVSRCCVGVAPSLHPLPSALSPPLVDAPPLRLGSTFAVAALQHIVVVVPNAW